jgi:hypothetical protein
MVLLLNFYGEALCHKGMFRFWNQYEILFLDTQQDKKKFSSQKGHFFPFRIQEPVYQKNILFYKKKMLFL